MVFSLYFINHFTDFDEIQFGKLAVEFVGQLQFSGILLVTKPSSHMATNRLSMIP
jgi:hypothetical protein